MNYRSSKLIGIALAFSLLAIGLGTQSQDAAYAAVMQEETVYLPSVGNRSMDTQPDGEIVLGNEEASAQIEELPKPDVDLDAIGPVSADSVYQDGDGPWAEAAKDTSQDRIESAASNAFDANGWTVRNNLGVGTDSPVHRLEINDNVNWVNRLLIRNNHAGSDVSSDMYLTTGSAKGLMIQKFGSGFNKFRWAGIPLANYARIRTDTGVKGLIQSTGSGPMIFGTGDKERLRLHANGGLRVRNSASYGIRVDEASQVGVHIDRSGTDGLLVSNAGTDGVRVHYPLQNGLYVERAREDGVYVNNAEQNGIVVNQATDYGVHVISPGSAIGVNVDNGSVRVNGGSFITVNSSLSVPDYVFEDEYPLMSLEELRAFIKIEKHLPNVPSEDEIHAEGLDLSEFHMRLLEKVEELTLYTLQQQDVIETQQHDMHGQQRQIETQESTIALLLAELETVNARLSELEQQ